MHPWAWWQGAIRVVETLGMMEGLEVAWVAGALGPHRMGRFGWVARDVSRGLSGGGMGMVRITQPLGILVSGVAGAVETTKRTEMRDNKGNKDGSDFSSTMVARIELPKIA